MTNRLNALTHWVRACALTAPMLIVAASAAAQTQSWDYKSYLKDRTSGQYSKDRFVSSTITLDEKDGVATFRMVSPRSSDLCINKGALPATVERAAETITIVVTPELAGCEPFRYVIKTDGSGGVRYLRKDDRWVPDGFDHGLTPVQR